ncbi:hypothetical protein AAV98_07450 [Bacillus sp. CHD6a]|nr:hypothetical protein AAV98_07450 [Bacillus sp. CHD6a]
MKVSKSLLIWMVCYICVFSYVLLEYRNISSHPYAINDTMLYLTLTKSQKLLFNNAIFIALLIFCTRREFLEPMIFVRYQRKLTLEIIRRGMVISLSYVLTTIVLITMFAFIFNIKIDLSFNSIVHFLYLYLFGLYVYFFYALLYLLFSNHTLAILLNIGMNFLSIATIINIVWHFGMSESLLDYLLMLYLMVATPLLVISVIFAGRYKECL